MCLIAFAFKADPRYRLVLAGNRDEFRARPSAPLHCWADYPQILGGRDLRAQGTWLGISRSGRLAALTNIRNPKASRSGERSRGELVVASILATPTAPATAYAGYNLIVGDLARGQMWIDGNHPEQVRRALSPGIYGLSNGALDDPWPKTSAAHEGLGERIQRHAGVDDLAASLLEMLENKTIFADYLLPHTGVDQELERRLSPLFIDLPEYGTRASSVVIVETSGRCHFFERNHDTTPAGLVKIQFRIDQPEAA